MCVFGCPFDVIGDGGLCIFIAHPMQPLIKLQFGFTERKRMFEKFESCPVCGCSTSDWKYEGQVCIQCCKQQESSLTTIKKAENLFHRYSHENRPFSVDDIQEVAKALIAAEEVIQRLVDIYEPYAIEGREPPEYWDNARNWLQNNSEG